MLPTFIVIGAQKSGTSSLFAYMRTHPEVQVASEKEPKYFVKERAWSRGRTWYESLFDSAVPRQARGEFTPEYTTFPIYAGVPGRMAALVPEVRLIYLMRHPIRRMVSSYRHGLWAGVEVRPLRQALLEDARYIYPSMYALQVEQYLEHFPRSQILLVTAEDLRVRRVESLRRIFSFLDVDPDWIPPNVDETFNTSEGRTRPRRWARLVGDAMVRLGEDRRMPAVVERGLARVADHPVARAPIGSADLDLDDDTAQDLSACLRRDLRELKTFMDPSFDAWGLLTGSEAPGRS